MCSSINKRWQKAVDCVLAPHYAFIRFSLSLFRLITECLDSYWKSVSTFVRYRVCTAYSFPLSIASVVLAVHIYVQHGFHPIDIIRSISVFATCRSWRYLYSINQPKQKRITTTTSLYSIMAYAWVSIRYYQNYRGFIKKGIIWFIHIILFCNARATSCIYFHSFIRSIQSELQFDDIFQT